MCVGLDRSKIVNGDDFDIVAVGLDDGAQDIAADAAEAVDGNADGHYFRSQLGLLHALIYAGHPAFSFSLFNGIGRRYKPGGASDSRRKGAPDTEAYNADPIDGGAGKAAGRAELHRGATKGAAAGDTKNAVRGR